MKDSHNIKDSPTLYEQEIKSVKERLTRCLQLLKINYNDSQISTTAFKLIEKAIPEQIAKKTNLGQWIIALNAIAGSCSKSAGVLTTRNIRFSCSSCHN